jgi:hypothetical protein
LRHTVALLNLRVGIYMQLGCAPAIMGSQHEKKKKCQSRQNAKTLKFFSDQIKFVRPPNFRHVAVSFSTLKPLRHPNSTKIVQENCIPSTSY